MDQRHKAPVFILSLGVCWHGCQVQTCETETKGNGKLVAIFEMFEGHSYTEPIHKDIVIPSYLDFNIVNFSWLFIAKSHTKPIPRTDRSHLGGSP